MKKLLVLLKLFLVFLQDNEFYENQLPVRGPPLTILNSFYSQILEKIQNTKNGNFQIKLLYLTPENDLWKFAFLIKNTLKDKLEFIGIETYNLQYENNERFKTFFQTEDFDMFNYVMRLKLNPQDFEKIPEIQSDEFLSITCEEKEKNENKPNLIDLFEDFDNKNSDKKKKNLSIVDYVSEKNKKVSNFFNKLDSNNDIYPHYSVKQKNENNKNPENLQEKKNAQTEKSLIKDETENKKFEKTLADLKNLILKSKNENRNRNSPFQSDINIDEEAEKRNEFNYPVIKDTFIHEDSPGDEYNYYINHDENNTKDFYLQDNYKKIEPNSEKKIENIPNNPLNNNKQQNSQTKQSNNLLDIYLQNLKENETKNSSIQDKNTTSSYIELNTQNNDTSLIPDKYNGKNINLNNETNKNLFNENLKKKLDDEKKNVTKTTQNEEFFKNPTYYQYIK